jgi:transposase
MATLEAVNREQQATIAAQQQEIDQLQHFVQRLLRDRFGPRSEKVDPNQLSLFEEQDQEPAADDAAAPDEPSIVVQQHTRRDHRARKLPDSLPRELIEHDLSDAEKLCPDCGATRQRIGSESSEQLEFVPASLKVIEHVRYKYACKHCEAQVAIAPAPAKPIERGLPGPGLIAHVIVSKYSDHMPLYRLEDELARHGMELSRGTLCRWAQQAAKLLEPLYDLMVERVRKSAVIHTDDTPVPVLDPDLPNTRDGRFWVYVGDANNPYCVYDYTSSRKRDGPAAFLREFQGFLQADAYGGYDGIYATQDVSQVSCWAHARRKFYDARTIQPAEAHAALGYIRQLYAIEAELRERMPRDFRDNAEARRKWYELRAEHRQQRARPILEQFQIWLNGTQQTVLPKSPVGQAIAYVWPRLESFRRYCEDGRLEIDNNLAERMLRGCAIGRKNWLFVGGDDAGRAAAIHFSFVASAKHNELEPWAYLRDAIETLSGMREDAPPDEATLAALLPDAWLQAHPDAHRRYSR